MVFSPAKMEIIKITSRASIERQLIRALHDQSEIQFIDVEKKGLASSAKISESETEQEILTLLGKVSSMTDILNIEGLSEQQELRQLDFEDLSETLQHILKIYNGLEPEYEEIMEHLQNSQREVTELDTLLETTKILNPLKVEFSVLGDGKFFTVFTGSVGSDKVERLEWNIKELTDDSAIINSSPVHGEKGLTAIVVGALHRYKEDIARVLASFGFVELSVPSDMEGKPTEIEENTKARKYELQNVTIPNWESKKAEFIKKYAFDLLSIKEQLSIERERIDARRLMKQENFVIQFWGYVPRSQLNKTEDIVKAVDPDAMFEIEDKDFHDGEYPTKMENHKYIGKPYEPMVKTFGTPDYSHDFDPSPFFAFWFPVLFGIMFADILHGILLTILGFFAMRMQPLGRQPDGMKDELKNYLKLGSFVLFVSGIASTIFGVLFWSFGGLHGDALLGEEGHAPSFMQEGGFLYFLKPLHLWSNNGDPNPNFGGASGTFLFLQLSLLIAIIHIGLALFLLFLNKIRQKHYTEAILFPGMLLIGYFSASLLVFTFSLDIFSWWSDQTLPLTIAVLTPLFGYNTLGLQIHGTTTFIIMVLAFGTFMVYEIIKHGMDGFSEGLDFTLSLLGNSVSYARLFAINIVHGILSLLLYSAFSFTADSGKLKLPFDVVHHSDPVAHGASLLAEQAEAALSLVDELMIAFAFIVGTLIVMTFELMVTFLQALRLHLVEFFSKLHFSGAGHEFKPFKSTRRFTQSVIVKPSVDTS